MVIDQLSFIHSLPKFEQKAPLLVNVELSVKEKQGLFHADLSAVRDQLARIHPYADILFNLTIVGKTGEATVAKWEFPASEVPGAATLKLSLGSYAGFKREILTETVDAYNRQ